MGPAAGEILMSAATKTDTAMIADSERDKWNRYYAAVDADLAPEVLQLGAEFCSWAEELLSSYSSVKVLEAGSGAGFQSVAFAQNQRFEAHLLDFSENALTAARSLFSRLGLAAHFHSGDIFDPGEKDYDFVFNSGVLEHYSFEEQVAMVRSMAARSRFLVAALVPNANCYWYWISRTRAASLGSWPFGFEAPMTRLTEVFQAAGLTAIEERYFGRAWCETFFDNLPELAPELKDILVSCHRSKLIRDEQACYLMAAAGVVGNSSTTTYSCSRQSFETDTMRAIAADALSLRLAGDNEAKALRAQAAERQSELEQRTRQRDEALEKARLLEQKADALEQRVAVLEGEFSSGLASVLDQASRFKASYDNALREYKRQRAWKLMLIARKSYDLWVRRGLKGKLQAVRLLACAPFLGEASYSDQELTLPRIEDYISARAAVAPRSAARQRCRNTYDVVVLPIIDFNFRFQRPQQIAAQFAREGHRVFWVSPTRFLPPDAPGPYEAVLLRENLWEIRLRAEPSDIYLGELSSKNEECYRSCVAALFKDYAISEAAVVTQLPFWRRLALGLREDQGAAIVYDCMDEWDSFENMGAFNRQEELSFARECDVLIVSAQKLVDKFISRGLAPVLVRNGVDYDFFAASTPGNELAGIPRPIIGYYGAIADWIDLDLIYKTAVARPQYSFVLIGEVFGRDTSRLEALQNVRLLGNQPYERLPAYLHSFDVCHIPFLLNEVTAATDPVKLYEYLSLGKPVVATDMAELRRYDDVVLRATDASDYAVKLDAALSGDNPDLRRRRIEFAKQNTWKARVSVIDSSVRSVFPLVSIIIVCYNSERYISGCLDSIWRNTSYPNYEVIVIDNASKDATVEILQRQQAAHPSLHCQFEKVNHGFAASNNLGAQLCRGSYLVLLNADTLVTAGWIGNLMRHLQRDPSIGIICPVTNFAGNEAKITVGYSSLPEMETFALDLASLRRGVSSDVRMVPLFCGMIRADIFRKIGGLDEEYRIGMFEDDDLAAQVRSLGLRAVVAEDCFIHHFGQGSFGKLHSQEYEQLFDENRKYFERKWKTGWTPHKLRPGVRAPFDERRFEPEEFSKT